MGRGGKGKKIGDHRASGSKGGGSFAKGGGKSGSTTRIEWVQGSILDARLEELLRSKMPSSARQGGADAVAIMFAIQFAFVSRESAAALVRTCARLLRPGGHFFGTAPDGAAISAALPLRLFLVARCRAFSSGCVCHSNFVQR